MYPRRYDKRAYFRFQKRAHAYLLRCTLGITGSYFPYGGYDLCLGLDPGALRTFAKEYEEKQRALFRRSIERGATDEVIREAQATLWKFLEIRAFCEVVGEYLRLHDLEPVVPRRQGGDGWRAHRIFNKRENASYLFALWTGVWR